MLLFTQPVLEMPLQSIKERLWIIYIENHTWFGKCFRNWIQRIESRNSIKETVMHMATFFIISQGHSFLRN